MERITFGGYDDYPKIKRDELMDYDIEFLMLLEQVLYSLATISDDNPSRNIHEEDYKGDKLVRKKVEEIYNLGIEPNLFFEHANKEEVKNLLDNMTEVKDERVSILSKLFR